MSDFKVISVVFCDYVSQDANGRAIQLGISQEELRLLATPSMLAQIFIVTTIKPISRIFRYLVDFDAPDGSRIIRLNASCDIGVEIPPRHLISTNLQTPAIPFPGEGEYSVKIRDESQKIVFMQPLHIVVGPQLDLELNFKGQVEVGEKYAQPQIAKQ